MSGIMALMQIQYYFDIIMIYSHLSRFIGYEWIPHIKENHGQSLSTTDNDKLIKLLKQTFSPDQIKDNETAIRMSFNKMDKYLEENKCNRDFTFYGEYYIDWLQRHVSYITAGLFMPENKFFKEHEELRVNDGWFEKENTSRDHYY